MEEIEKSTVKGVKKEIVDQMKQELDDLKRRHKRSLASQVESVRSQYASLFEKLHSQLAEQHSAQEI